MAPMKTVLSMNPEGRLTVPAAVRIKLGVEGETQFEVEVSKNAIILRPVEALPREDAWASNTAEQRRLLRRAHRDSREGRVMQLDESDLERLAE